MRRNLSQRELSLLSLLIFRAIISFPLLIYDSLLVPSGAPNNFEIVNVSSSEVSYVWDDNLTTINGQLLGYNLYYAEEGQNPIRIQFPVSSLGPYTHVLTQLNPNTRYSFFLSVDNHIGEGPNSTFIWITTDPVGELFVYIQFPIKLFRINCILVFRVRKRAEIGQFSV